LGVLEDSKSPTLGVLGFTPTLGQSGVVTTNLLEKPVVTYKWEGTCDEAFETLKGILVKALMLKLPNSDKDFEIHADAFNFVIGRT
jgi:hypothetical protein